MFKVNKQKVNGFFSAVITFFALLLCLNFSAKAQAAKSVEDLVKSLSGGKLQVETRAVPYYLAADFDGDKVEDVAVIVNLSDTVKNIAETVKIEYPYPFGKQIDDGDLALFIIHGKGKGWQFAQKSSVLLLGRSSAMIFQKRRLGEQGEGGNNLEIKKDKRGKASLLFGTEASEGILKWNGKKYVWTEDEEP
ncbi:MAG: hypothetical protein ACR2HG_15035 [Pyrinomonadaceae bacterium]